MAVLSRTSIGLTIFIAVTAFLYQFLIRDTLFVTYGIGRPVQKISDFPYKCRKIIDRQVEACEDMWLDEQSRTLYLACSDPISRVKWMPK